ncbi:acyl carrier protein [Ruegeria sp. AU67]|uniref:acyl carrier protein n=1 Tax=Ruegeria sp. AU67 TaxID=2108530 RepID=UPI000D69B503|nr:acyl carrier protein [Ruegeria sp. AU67]
MDIHQELTFVFRDILASPTLELSNETTAEDIDQWDSAMHIVLIFAIEDRFGFKFSGGELETLYDIQSLKSVIEQRATRT